MRADRSGVEEVMPKRSCCGRLRKEHTPRAEGVMPKRSCCSDGHPLFVVWGRKRVACELVLNVLKSSHLGSRVMVSGVSTRLSRSVLPSVHEFVLFLSFCHS